MAPDVQTAAGLLRFGNLFCDAKVLLTAVELGLFAELEDGPATTAEIRDRLDLHGRGLAHFLATLVSIGVLVEEDGVFRNADGAQRHLVPGADEFVGGFLIGAGRTLYPAYGNLGETLRTGAAQAGGDFAKMIEDPGALAQFAQMMDGLNETLGPLLAGAFDWSGHRRVLDVGGCRGNLLSHVLRAGPGLTGQVFDLPPMGPLFERHMAEQDLSERASFHGGDFFTDRLPAADVVICGHVLSDWNADERLTLLRKAADALEPGGELLVYDRMLVAGTDNRENLVASLSLMLMTDGGGAYSVAELQEQARTAGFGRFTHRPLGAYDTLVTAVRN
ncbi:methyltransferase [Amycolatopsis ultiminotia]|uniref:Methyltransferase n=1 Tax=Amycolatopsis ultiminotia TaxID=543629 RepID=A0ABP6YG32_9PSEU